MYTIYDVMEACGRSKRTVYDYVRQGLLPRPGGSRAQPVYTNEHLRRCREIRRCLQDDKVTRVDLAERFGPRFHA